MAFKAGTTTAWYLANAANSLQNLSPYTDNVSVPLSTEQLDVSTFGTAAKSMIPGLQFGDTITVSGPYDVVPWTQLTTAMTAGSLLGFIYGPAGSVASQARVAGSAYVSQVSPPSSVGGRVEFSYSLQITGAVSLGTF